MTRKRFSIKGKPGRKLDFAVERLCDGAFHHPDCGTWREPRGRAPYGRIEPLERGRYGAPLPELDPEQDYLIHVIDVDTQQLVRSRLIDGRGGVIIAPRVHEDHIVGAQKSSPTPAPDLAEIAAGIRLLVAHWLARGWAERQNRNFAIAAVCVLAAFLLWPRGPSREDVEKARVLAEQRAIREVIAQDKALGQQIAQRVGVMDQYWDGSALVAEFADRMDAVDLAACPQDFQLAYKRHVAAWAAVARVKASNEGFNGAVKGLFTAGLSVLPAMSEVNQAMKEVQSSWSEVQQATIRHGVAP